MNSSSNAYANEVQHDIDEHNLSVFKVFLSLFSIINMQFRVQHVETFVKTLEKYKAKSDSVTY
jgi:hypothetical protein